MNKMDEQELDKLIRKKSELLSEALSFIEKDETRAKELIAEAAPLEERISTALEQKGDIFNAVVSLISASNCYLNIGNYKEAVRVNAKVNEINKYNQLSPEIIKENKINMARAEEKQAYALFANLKIDQVRNEAFSRLTASGRYYHSARIYNSALQAYQLALSISEENPKSIECCAIMQAQLRTYISFCKEKLAN